MSKYDKVATIIILSAVSMVGIIMFGTYLSHKTNSYWPLIVGIILFIGVYIKAIYTATRMLDK